MLKQTDLPFTIENKKLFLLRGGISWMQGNYVRHLRRTNYLLYLKVTHVWARSKCGNMTLKTLYQYFLIHSYLKQR